MELDDLIHDYTREAGVRQLKKLLELRQEKTLKLETYQTKEIFIGDMVKSMLMQLFEWRLILLV